MKRIYSILTRLGLLLLGVATYGALSTLGATKVVAQSNAFEAGLQAYSQAEYQQAVSFFRQALNEAEQPTAELYYNLGAAHYKNGELPQAILHFSRAHRINPSDSDIQFNLHLAKSQQIDQLEEVGSSFIAKWWQRSAMKMSLTTWVWLTSLLFLLFLAGLFAFLRGRSKKWRKGGFILGVASLCLCLLTLSFTLTLHSYIYDTTEAILMDEVVTVKSSPDQSATDIVVVHGGLQVTTAQEVAGYTEITLPDGNVGWVPSSSLQLINQGL